MLTKIYSILNRGQIIFCLFLILSAYNLKGQSGGLPFFTLNGTHIDLSTGQNVLFLDNPCSVYTLCFSYLNFDDLDKEGDIVIHIPNMYEIIDPGFFVLGSPSPYQQYIYAFEVEALDEEAEEYPTAGTCITIRQRDKGQVLPFLLFPTNQFFNINITHPATESYQQNPPIQSNPNTFIGTSGSSELISDIELQYPGLINDACLNSGGPTGLVVSGTILLDENFCFKNMNVILGAGVVMREHSKIVVQGSKQFLIENTDMYGCEELWEAIEIDPGGMIKVENSRIRDGFEAIRFLFNTDPANYSVGIIKNSTFEDNWISVSSEYPILQTGLSHILLHTESNLFNRNIGVKSFSPHGFYGSSFPFMAMNLVKTVYTYIKGGSVPGNPTVIKDMYHGIYFEGAQLGLEECDIHQIIADNQFSTSGRGIYGSGVSGHLYISPNLETKFNQMEQAIQTTQSTIDINNCTITNVKSGIRHGWSLEKYVSIDNCRITTSYQGVGINNTTPLVDNQFKSKITNNSIFQTNPGQLPNAGGLAIINTVVNTREGYLVEANDIELDHAEYGILLNASSIDNVRNNHIIHGQTVATSAGIRSNAGVYPFIGCNYIDVSTALPTVSSSAGIWVSQTAVPEIACNQMYNFARGSYFEQTNVLSDFKGNFIANTNNDGLLLENATIIGQQHHKGNLFPSKGNPSLFEARNFSNDQIDIDNSRFIVDQNANPLFMPNWWTSLGPSSMWFEHQTSINTFQCDSMEQMQVCEPLWLMTEGNRGSMMDLTQEGAWWDGLMGETQHYIGVRQLLQNIELYPQEQPGEDLDGWLRYAEETDAGRWHSYELGLHDLLSMDNSTSATMSELLSQVGSLRESLKNRLSECGNPDICREDINDLTLEYAQVVEGLDDLYGTQDTRIRESLPAYRSAAPVLETVAANLHAEVIGYTLDQLLAPGEDILSPLIPRLLEIARLCPSEYGPAVYESRGLLLSLQSDIEWDDSACIEISGRSRIAGEQLELPDSGKIKVKPTIFDQEIWIEFDTEITEYSRIEMMDIHGRIVYVLSISGEQNTYNINTSTLIKGVYFIRVKGENADAITFKLIKP